MKIDLEITELADGGDFCRITLPCDVSVSVKEEQRARLSRYQILDETFQVQNPTLPRSIKDCLRLFFLASECTVVSLRHLC